MLVEETADAVLSLSSRFGQVDTAELLTACRRILSSRPVGGPLWWMAARVLTATDVRREVHELIEELDNDRTPIELEAALDHGATVTIVGWSIQAAQGLIRRGDVTVMVIDALGEGHEVARQLGLRGIDARAVPPENAGAAIAASDVVLVEASVAGPDEALCITGSMPAATVAKHLDVPVWLIAGVGYRLPRSLYGSAIARWDTLHGTAGDGSPLKAAEVTGSGTLHAHNDDPYGGDRYGDEAASAGAVMRQEERLGIDLIDRVLCEAGLLACPPIPNTPNFPKAPELERLGVVLGDTAE